jgi:hypothetical protein
MTCLTTSEVDSQLEIASHWRPTLDAVGVDTRGWSPWDLWRLAKPHVLNHPAVAESLWEKHNQWRRENFRIYGNKPADFFPPYRLTLDAIRELPEAIKKEIQARIADARGKK